MIAFNQVHRATRPTWRAAGLGGIKVVPACFYGFSSPRPGSRVIVGHGAQCVLEWWPRSRQHALYAAIDADKLTFEPKANGCEMVELSSRFDHHYMVVRRTTSNVNVLAIYNELPQWEVR